MPRIDSLALAIVLCASLSARDASAWSPNNRAVPPPYYMPSYLYPSAVPSPPANRHESNHPRPSRPFRMSTVRGDNGDDSDGAAAAANPSPPPLGPLDTPIPLTALLKNSAYLYRCPGHKLDGTIVNFRRGLDGVTNYVRPKNSRAGGLANECPAFSYTSTFYPEEAAFMTPLPGYGPADEAAATKNAAGAAATGRMKPRPPDSSASDVSAAAAAAFPAGFAAPLSSSGRPVPSKNPAVVAASPPPPRPESDYYSDTNADEDGRQQPIPVSKLQEKQNYLFRCPDHELDGAIVEFRHCVDRATHQIRPVVFNEAGRSDVRWTKVYSYSSAYYPVPVPGGDGPLPTTAAAATTSQAPAAAAFPQPPRSEPTGRTAPPAENVATSSISSSDRGDALRREAQAVRDRADDLAAAAAASQQQQQQAVVRDLQIRNQELHKQLADKAALQDEAEAVRKELVGRMRQMEEQSSKPSPPPMDQEAAVLQLKAIRDLELANKNLRMQLERESELHEEAEVEKRALSSLIRDMQGQISESSRLQQEGGASKSEFERKIQELQKQLDEKAVQRGKAISDLQKAEGERKEGVLRETGLRKQLDETAALLEGALDERGELQAKMEDMQKGFERKSASQEKTINNLEVKVKEMESKIFFIDSPTPDDASAEPAPKGKDGK